MPKTSNLLKIHLNLFEISNTVLKFENLFQTWTMRSGAMCMYSTLPHDKLEYTQIFRQDKNISDLD